MGRACAAPRLAAAREERERERKRDDKREFHVAEPYEYSISFCSCSTYSTRYSNVLQERVHLRVQRIEDDDCDERRRGNGTCKGNSGSNRIGSDRIGKGSGMSAGRRATAGLPLPLPLPLSLSNVVVSRAKVSLQLAFIRLGARRGAARLRLREEENQWNASECSANGRTCHVTHND